MARSIHICPFCGKKFKTKEILKKHIATKERENVVALAYAMTFCDLVGRIYHSTGRGK
jgi:uncharacterized protein (DUF2225 family)